MKRFLIITFFVSLIIILSCEMQSKYQVTDFPGVLDVKNIPAEANDWSAFCLADLGAWYGLALPSEMDTAYWGGFSGPFLMTHGQWISPSLFQLILHKNGKSEVFDFGQSEKVTIQYFPGRLTQSYLVEGLEINMTLAFVSNQSALVQVNIKNVSVDTTQISLGWKGSVFMEGTAIQSAEQGILVTIPETEIVGRINLPEDVNTSITVAGDQKTYSIKIDNPVTIAPQKTYQTNLIYTYSDSKEELDQQKEIVIHTLSNSNIAMQKNAERWNGYLNSILNVKSKWSSDPSYQRIAVKAMMTLINNWKRGRGDLLHDGLFPSYAVGYFNGFWAWDSWKHAVALAEFAPEVAKDQIRAMFDYQDEFGMVADCIYADQSENNWRDTKPPLAAWAVWKVYQATKDKDFLEEMLPKVEKYHKWWYDYRDHDQNGLCEYGSTDGTYIAARWESGMDDGVRFDNRKMVPNRKGAWSIDQESVDLNSFLYKDKRYLALIIRALGDTEKSQQFMDGAENLKKKIQTQMFDEETGFFYDIDLVDKSFIKVQGSECWVPLWVGVANNEQAAMVQSVMTDTSKFATYIPLPTLAKDHPAFLTGYWRGPVWVDQVYFGIRGLERYGFNTEAEVFTRQLFDRPEGLKDVPGPIRENYHPLTGAGLKVNHFSWSSVHLLLLFMGK